MNYRYPFSIHEIRLCFRKSCVRITEQSAKLTHLADTAQEKARADFQSIKAAFRGNHMQTKISVSMNGLSCCVGRQVFSFSISLIFLGVPTNGIKNPGLMLNQSCVQGLPCIIAPVLICPICMPDCEDLGFNLITQQDKMNLMTVE